MIYVGLEDALKNYKSIRKLESILLVPVEYITTNEGEDTREFVEVDNKLFLINFITS